MRQIFWKRPFGEADRRIYSDTCTPAQRLRQFGVGLTRWRLPSTIARSSNPLDQTASPEMPHLPPPHSGAIAAETSRPAPPSGAAAC